MDEFVNSPIYKAAMRVSHVYNYIFIAVGIIITFGPGIKYLMMTAEELEERQVTTASVVTPMIMGALFTFNFAFCTARSPLYNLHIPINQLSAIFIGNFGISRIPNFKSCTLDVPFG